VNLTPTHSRIVFVYPPATLSPRPHISGQFNLCLGSAYIIAYLREKGITASPFLFNRPIDAAECTRQILAHKPKLVGFTVYSSNYCACQLLARYLKEADPDIIILFGGPTPTVQARTVLENNAGVDICVRNEGEETCLEIIASLERAAYRLPVANLENIPGITYRHGPDIRENSDRLIPIDLKKAPGYLDRFPSPYLSGLAGSPRLGILTARGCHRSCVYCNCALLSRRFITTHSIDRVMAEFLYIQERFGPPYPITDIFDDAFTLIPQRAIDICRAIIKEKIRLPLTCVTRCDFISEDILDLIKEAGFKAVGFSLESAVPRVLRTIGKVSSPDTDQDPTFEKEKEFIDKFKKYVVYAKKIGIDVVYASIMIGLPGETEAEAGQTIAMIDSLKDYLHFYAHNQFQVYPGTPIFANHEEYGLKLLAFQNQVHYKTIYPFDLSRIKLGDNANLIGDSQAQDQTNIKTLALAITRKNDHANAQEAPFFGQLILENDHIGPGLVRWLQRYFAINGHIIQVYSSLAAARKFHLENEQALSQYISPTYYHAAYYRTAIDPPAPYPQTLTPFRFHVLGPQCGFSILLTQTRAKLGNRDDGKDPWQTLCIDRNPEDTRALHQFLQEIESRGTSLTDLFAAPLFPNFHHLCRFQGQAPNCRLLETLFVDEKDQLRTCLTGEPIGQVGMPLEEIGSHLERLHQGAAERRGCAACPQAGHCAQCLFTNPLAEAEYCSLQRQSPVHRAADSLRTLDIFKDILPSL